MPVLDVGTTFALLTEPEILDETHNGNREGIIGHEDVDLSWGDPRVAKGNGARLGAGTDGNIGVVSAILGGFPGADDPYRLLVSVTDPLRGGKDQRTTAVGDHTAFEQPQWMGNRPGGQDIVDGNLAHAHEFQVS